MGCLPLMPLMPLAGRTGGRYITSGADGHQDAGGPGRPRIFPRVGAWRSLVAHLLREQGVGGSNPLAPTKFTQQNQG
jgi:hypothetical protein